MAETVRTDPGLPMCRSRRHDGGFATPHVAPGLRICAECRHQVEENLVTVPDLYEMCAYALDLRNPHPRERVDGHRPRGIVLRDAVVTVRSDILGVLASWCGLVASERGVAGPDELSIRRLTTFVLVHLTWLTEHPAAPEFADELADLTDSAHEVLTPNDNDVLDLGPCASPGCARTVRADGHPPTRVGCDAGHEWAPERWLLLRGRPNGHQNGNGNGNGNRNGNGNGNGHHNGHPAEGRRVDPHPEGAE